MSSKDSIQNIGNYYSGRCITSIKDSIFIISYFFDEKFNPINMYKIKFLQRNNDLYRTDIHGNEIIFLTTKTTKNVFFPIVLYDTDGCLDSVYGINHKFISKIKIKDNQNNDVSVYKFFVREGRYEDVDTSYTGESDYYSYYTEDLILYRKEYIGTLPTGSNKERLHIKLDLKNSDFENTNIETLTFLTE